MYIIHENNRIRIIIWKIAGATLSEAGASTTWDPVASTEDYQTANYKLQIKQILLGHTAKADEYNVVQVKKYEIFHFVSSIWGFFACHAGFWTFAGCEFSPS